MRFNIQKFKNRVIQRNPLPTKNNIFRFPKTWKRRLLFNFDFMVMNSLKYITNCPGLMRKREKEKK